jgi:hypothetical protein
MGLLKINLVIIVLISFFGLSFGSVQADEDAPPFHVQQVDPSFDSQKMAGPGVKVHGAEEFKESDWKIPEKKDRDAIFLRVGLKAEVGAWDEMDKDVLFLTARDSNTKKLLKSYPKLPKEKLLELARLTKEAPK